MHHSLWFKQLAVHLWRHPRLRITLGMAAVAAALLSLLLLGSLPGIGNASDINLLVNPDFEDSFSQQGGCGAVAVGWNCFSNGGAVQAAFSADAEGQAVASGRHSQQISLSTLGISGPDHDRYAGLYQTVAVREWQPYVLSLKGLIRSNVASGDPWRYRVQVGWSQGSSANWQTVNNWTDVGWDRYGSRAAPGSFNSYSSTILAESNYITVYVRVWKKWGVPEEELLLNLDALSLIGPSPSYLPKAVYPSPTPTPAPAYPAYPSVPGGGGAVAACSAGADLIVNGGFEHGFATVALGHVGAGWGTFTNGGRVHVGFYDDMWSPVVASGSHAQLIELSTKGSSSGDADRYAGIYQHVSGLTPGALYELTVKGLLRGEGGGDDAHRFAAQWGWASGYTVDWTHVPGWSEIDLGAIYARTAPGPIQTYTVRFQAPSSTVTLFIRGWKKWGTGETEMDLNVDDISLRACSGTPTYPPPPPPPPPAVCTYTVKPGDYLGRIATQFGVSVYGLARANHITNLNHIYVGQRLVIPGCAGGPGGYPPPPPPPTPQRTHTVAPGQTLSSIAAHYGINMYALARANSIVNLNRIYVGQVLILP